MRVVPDIGWLDVTVRLLVAAALSGAIGAERELRERVAGLRTHMLVGIGSALFTLVSAYAWGDFVFDRTRGTVLDPSRIAAQIVTGIGFLGAGAILRQGLSVRGLTTAAGLWVAAAIGMAAGAGFYPAAVITTVVVLVGLGPFRWIESAISRLGGASGVLELDLSAAQPVSPVLELVRARRARIANMEFEAEEDVRHLRLYVDLPMGTSERSLVEEFSAQDHVLAARWSKSD
ncbi:MAG: MgtC/SapB family protein [Actinomycetota bacterium]|nr:MgtC/SapB family protein [Actinomycetota bacterium]